MFYGFCLWISWKYARCACTALEVGFSHEQSEGKLYTAPIVHVAGREITPYLVEDSAYPLSPWLMKPYPEGTRDPGEIAFNKELPSARVQVECAFSETL